MVSTLYTSHENCSHSSVTLGYSLLGSKEVVQIMQWDDVWQTLLCDSSGCQLADAGLSNDNGRRKLTYQLEETAHGAITMEAILKGSNTMTMCLAVSPLSLSLKYSLSSFSKACSITRLAALSGTHRQQAEDTSIQSATNKMCAGV